MYYNRSKSKTLEASRFFIFIFICFDNNISIYTSTSVNCCIFNYISSIAHIVYHGVYNMSSQVLRNIHTHHNTASFNVKYALVHHFDKYIMILYSAIITVLAYFPLTKNFVFGFYIIVINNFNMEII